jgi:hypothetical protein
MCKPFACDPNNLWTNEVYTLWYRAPEILLSGPADYSIPADVWAAAVTIWEVYSGEVLFRGDSELNQMFHIFRNLGTPGTGSLWPEAEFMTNFKPNFPKWKENRQNINNGLPNDDIRRLINSMLVYDPNKRASMYSVLTDPYFDSVRTPSAEVGLTNCFQSHETRDLRIAADFMKNVPNVNRSMRSVLVDWMCDVFRMFKLKFMTYLRFASLLDQTLPIINPSNANLQLLGCEVATLAANISEVYWPELNDFVYISDNAFTQQELIDMRIRVLVACNYDLFYTVPYDYYEMNYSFENINYDIWGLAKALILLSTDLPIRFALFPKEIYYLSLYTAAKYYGVSLTPKGSNPELDRISAENYNNFVEQVSKFTKRSSAKDGFIGQFKKISSFTIDEVSDVLNKTE